MPHKAFVYAVFGIVSIAMLGFIISQKNHIQSDVYQLLELSPKIENLIKNTQESLSSNIALLSDDYDVFERVITLNESYDIFEEIRINASQNMQDYFSSMDYLKLATLDRVTYELITQDLEQFTTQHIQEIFSPLSLRVLDMKEDFFNLSAHSALMNIQRAIKLDFKTSRLYVECDSFCEGILYFGNAKLKQNYDSNALLAFIKELKAQSKNSILLISGGAIFSSMGKNEGNIESLYMGSLSILLVSALLLVGFGRVHIFKLIIIVAFSFLCALSGAFVVLKNIHLLSIVVSTSLIGLILDFAMHYLGHMNGKTIKPKSIRDMRHIFCIGLLITCSGYGLFFLSPMRFLQQIAIISVFALLGAFLATYFLLPHLLDDVRFRPSKICRICIIKCFKICQKILNHKSYLACIFAVIIFIGISHFRPQLLQDNIKNYSSLPTEILQETQDLARLTNQDSATKFIVLENPQDSAANDIIELEQNLVRELLSHNLIHHSWGLSDIVLSQKEQSRLKDSLASIKNNATLLRIYKDSGFDENYIQNALARVENLPVLNASSVLQHAQDLRHFVVDSAHIMFVGNPQTNEDFNQILSRHNAQYIDFSQILNESFTHIKNNAILLKLGAYIIAFIVLWVFFGLANAGIIIGMILLSSALSIAILLICGLEFNIFVIFGLILASAVGIDYALVAINDKLSLHSKIFGIALANLTSFISFFMLSTSRTNAIAGFGLSVSVCMELCAFLALLLAVSSRNVPRKHARNN